jgi:hypothetical protein
MLDAIYFFYRQPVAFEASLRSFRQQYPESTIVLIGDLGCYDYSKLAEKYKCHYLLAEKKIGTQNYSAHLNSLTLDQYLDLWQRAFSLMKEDYVLLLEDDTHVYKPVDVSFLNYTINGCNPGEKLHPLLTSWLGSKASPIYGGCGGCIFDKKFFQSIFSTMDRDSFKQVFSLLVRPLGADEVLSLICYRHGGTIGMYKGFTEVWYPDFKERLLRKEITVLHADKSLYNAPVPRALADLL